MRERQQAAAVLTMAADRVLHLGWFALGRTPGFLGFLGPLDSGCPNKEAECAYLAIHSSAAILGVPAAPAMMALHRCTGMSVPAWNDRQPDVFAVVAGMRVAAAKELVRP